VSLSIVNGYLCFSSCDQAKARQGKDPHPKPDGGDKAGDATNKPRAPDGPAVLFGGGLANLADLSANSQRDPRAATTPASGTDSNVPRTAVDILV
jgi:hypothetical protein